MAAITFIARMTVRNDRESEFIDLCRALTAHVRKSEPGVVFYEFFRLREPLKYAVIESFRDEESEKEHMSSGKLAEIAPKISDCLDGGWVREYFDPL